MQKTILLTWLLLFSVSLFGQSTFHKTYTDWRADGTFSVIPCKSGGYLLTSYQQSGGNKGILTRLDELGAVIWQKKFPSIHFARISVEAEDGFVMVGDTSYDFNHRGYTMVTKVSYSGSILWSKKLGNNLFKSIPANIIKVHNGFVVSGESNDFNNPNQSGSYFTKLDSNGNVLWSKIYSGTFSNSFNSPASLLVEGDTIYACGSLKGHGCFVRINLNTGGLIGLSSFGKNYAEDFSSIQLTQDGNFMLAGTTYSTTGSEESRPWVVKVNRMGQIIWSKTYNILGTSLGCKMADAHDGGFVLSMGLVDGFNNSFAILAKIDANGNLLWAYNYSAGLAAGLIGVMSMNDHSFLSVGRLDDFANLMLLKTDSLGHINNGCCPAPITFQVENFTPFVQSPALTVNDWESTIPFITKAITDTSFEVNDFCKTPITSIVEQIQVCQGDSIQINGNFFQAPNTIRDTVQNLEGGCDTVRVYNLVQVPQPFRVETISFCPGNSVEINGISYTQPDTISQFLPATTGCDTLLVTFLRLKNLPKKYETTTFCPGDTVFVNGTGYQFPGILPFPDTLPGAGIGCDTLLYHILAYPVQPSSVAIICPPDMVVSTAPATPLAVNYTMPTATTDCVCADLNFSLVQGFPSGAAFPIGNTQVCYSASDICGDFNSCCFKVEVEEELACDVKETGCIQYELLGISVDAAQNKTFRVRVTNYCVSPLVYMAIQVPNGVEAISPVQNSPYISFNNREYSVRNPNQSPFRSVRFKAVNDGIVAGQSDVFEYTLPAQANPVFIKVTTRLSSGVFYEAMLNTFGCVIHANKIADRSTSHTIPSPRVRVFPNPSNGELFIDFSEWESGTAQVRVLNVQGREMMQKLLATDGESQPFSVPLFLPDGLYFLEIKAENGERQIIKIVLRR